MSPKADSDRDGMLEDRLRTVEGVRLKGTGVVESKVNADRIKLDKHCGTLEKKFQRMERELAKQEKNRKKAARRVTYAYVALPVSLVVLAATTLVLHPVFLPNHFRRKKRRSQQKIEEIEDKLLALTEVQVKSTYEAHEEIITKDGDFRSVTTGMPYASVMGSGSNGSSSPVTATAVGAAV